MNADKTGEYIATSRKKLGMSQKELADELGISNKTVFNTFYYYVNSPPQKGRYL